MIESNELFSILRATIVPPPESGDLPHQDTIPAPPPSSDRGPVEVRIQVANSADARPAGE